MMNGLWDIKRIGREPKKIRKGRVENRVFYKLENEKEKLRLFDGSWSINLSFIEELKEMNVERILFKTRKYIYEITMAEAKEKGTIKTFKGEVKLIVPEKYWEKREVR